MKAYCFITYFPIYSFFSDLIIVILNAIKLYRISKLSETEKSLAIYNEIDGTIIPSVME